MSTFKKILGVSLIGGIILGATLTFSSCDFISGLTNNHEHKIYAVEAYEPTCAEVGVEAHFACECGKVFADAEGQNELAQAPYIEAKGHVGKIDHAREVTCDDDGLTEGSHCTVCGEILVEQTVIPALGHKVVIDEGIDATCTEPGLSVGSHCEKCEMVLVKQVEIPAKGHSETVIPGTPADCVNSGLTDGKKCGECGVILETQNEIPAKGHSETVVPGKAADCVNSGLTDGKKCSECGVILEAQNEIPAKGHVETVVPGTPADCVNSGLTEGKKCSVCGAVLEAQNVIPAKGHVETVVPGKAADCVNSGLTDGKKCSVCGVVLEAQSEIPAKNHLDENHDFICDACNEILCINHTPAEAIKENVVDPDCENAGHYDEVTKCITCGYEISRKTVDVPAIGHKVGKQQVEIIEAPTCTTNGMQRIYAHCENCGELRYSERLPIQATGHTDGKVEVKNVIEATCEADGSYDNVVCCSVCGVEIRRETIPVGALGHLFGEDAVLGEDLNYYLECQRCGARKITEPPVATEYDAEIDNSFVSNKANAFQIIYGSFGLATNGSHKIEVNEGSPAKGGLGGLDKATSYVYYDFVLAEDGFVDIVWVISGSNYLASANPQNIGLANMADHMTITLDGLPVDINGLALPNGNGTDSPVWWNEQIFVIKNVRLSAGVHTFKCDAKAAGGLNVSSMNINSTGKIVEKPIEITGADLVSEDGRAYYLLSFINNGYAMDQIKFWNEIDKKIIYYNYTYEIANGITTIKADITDIGDSIFYPHMTCGIAPYGNGSNLNGDVLFSGFTSKAVEVNGYWYELFDKYGMPTVTRVKNDCAIIGADLYEEGGKLYYTLTYRITGYDPASFEFFDGGTIYEVVDVEQNGIFYTFKIDASKYDAIWPHLRVNGKNWDGAANTSSSNGDVKVAVTTKSVSFGGRTYTLKNQWSMPTIVVG